MRKFAVGIVLSLPLVAVMPVVITAGLMAGASGGASFPSGGISWPPGGTPTPSPPEGPAYSLGDIPPPMLRLYLAAAPTCPGLAWEVLAAIGKVETDHGRNTAVSSAGAEGPMQFMPATWAVYGVDADGDGVADINDPVDAVFGAARYLCANGGGDPNGLYGAIWHYNHSDAYVRLVLSIALRYQQDYQVLNPPSG
ncbi:MAG: lytic transglycosylase domain-containing protein [Acidimicrobiales bacterium]